MYLRYFYASASLLKMKNCQNWNGIVLSSHWDSRAKNDDFLWCCSKDEEEERKNEMIIISQLNTFSSMHASLFLPQLGLISPIYNLLASLSPFTPRATIHPIPPTHPHCLRICHHPSKNIKYCLSNWNIATIHHCHWSESARVEYYTT